MDLNDPEQAPLDRVKALLSLYSDPKASTAYLLCDRHDPMTVAYTVVAPDQSSEDVSYGSLREESEALAAGLSALGMEPGDRIATLIGKSRAYLVTIMAIWRLGAVHVPLFTEFGPAAIALRITASCCKLIICDPIQRPKLLPSEDMPDNPTWRIVTTGAADADSLAYDDLFALAQPGFAAAPLGGNAPVIQIYTSGTTGVPKGVVVPLRALAGFQAYGEYGLGLQPDDMLWNAADPGWGYGLFCGVVSSLSTGVRSVLLQGGFSAETTFGVLSRHGITNFAAAPTVYRSLRTSGTVPPEDLKVRCATSAGEPLTPEVNEWALAALGVPVHDHYGQTEAGMLVNNHHHPALRRPLKPGSMGHALPGWRAVVLKADRDEPAEPGEQGRLAMDLADSPLAWFEGYVDDAGKSAEKFSSDGRWYLTGDVVSVDKDGYFCFSARDDDVIIMAGYRIGPFEVESVLAAHPAISECAVVAAPDAVRGEVLEAIVVLGEAFGPSSELTVELQDWVKRRYAAHAYPRQVHYVASLPRTPSGKVQRFMLRNQLRQSRGAEKGLSC